MYIFFFLTFHISSPLLSIMFSWNLFDCSTFWAGLRWGRQVIEWGLWERT